MGDGALKLHVSYFFISPKIVPGVHVELKDTEAPAIFSMKRDLVYAKSDHCQTTKKSDNKHFWGIRIGGARGFVRLPSNQTKSAGAV